MGKRHTKAMTKKEALWRECDLDSDVDRILSGMDEHARRMSIGFLFWVLDGGWERFDFDGEHYFRSGDEVLSREDLYMRYFVVVTPPNEKEAYLQRMRLIVEKRRIQADAVQRFHDLTYPEPNTGCWFYTGEYATKGYGRIYHNGIRKPAHRFSYELYNNTKVPDNLFVCHKCNMPACVNPDHLYIGTQSENMMQCARDGRLGNGSYEAKSVTQYALDGSEIRVYRSIIEATRAVSNSSNGMHVSLACRGMRKTAYGFIWKFTDGSSPPYKRPPKQKKLSF